MVRKSMYQKIQKCKRQGLLKVEISRKLDLDPGTVAKYYDMRESEYLERQQSNKYRDKVFDQYKKSILEVYRENDCEKLPTSGILSLSPFRETIGGSTWNAKRKSPATKPNPSTPRSSGSRRRRFGGS
jgi:hypothetical protein